jgi:hypothetical protein
MNCANHAETENIAFCIKCGKPLCAQCVRQVQASVYCESCLADSINGKTVTPKVQSVAGGSPEAAFVLGLIPGVGAIYNAEYFKAALHLLVFGTLITIADHSGRWVPQLPHLKFGIYVYMPFEAYYTAKKRKLAREGIVLETPFDLIKEAFGGIGYKELWGVVVLVVLGVFFLLDNFNIIGIVQIASFCPALLIVGGVLIIFRFSRFSRSGCSNGSSGHSGGNNE